MTVPKSLPTGGGGANHRVRPGTQAIMPELTQHRTEDVVALVVKPTFAKHGFVG